MCIYYLKYLINEDLVEADPTKTPLTNCRFKISEILLKFTEPPYKILIFLKVYFSRILVKNLQISSISDNSGVSPVPIDHKGSYAKIIWSYFSIFLKIVLI